MLNVYKQDVCCRAQLHRQLASMLALLLLFHNVAGKETQKDVPTIQHITSCPDIGYYFKRDVIPNAIDPGPCKLCFCQDNSTAICWLRESQRCDPKHYTFTGRKKRDNRTRRSPSFTDIFFRDAAREVFNKQSPEQCKPHESSFSEGCPPADWCIGCTVCDCDSNGRWDCHTLSFCDDKKGKKQVKKKRNSMKSRIVKRQLAKKSPSRTTKKPNIKTTKITNKKATKKFNKKPKVGKKPQIKQNKSKQNKNKVNKKTASTKKISPVKKSKKPFQKKKIPSKIKKGSNKNVQKGKKPIIKPNKGPRKTTTASSDQQQTVQFTKMILNKVMASVNKVVNENQKSLLKNKNVQKRSMTKKINNKKKRSQSNGGKKTKKWQPKKNVPKNRKQNKPRRKRQIAEDSKDYFLKENITNFPSKIDDIVFSPSRKYINELLSNEQRSISNTSNKYFEYNVDTKYEKNTIEKNNSEKQVLKSQILSKSNNHVNITAHNVTQTDSTGFGSEHNETTPTASLNIFYQQNNSLPKSSLNNTNVKKNKNCGQMCQLKKAFKMLIGDYGRRNVTKKRNNAKNKSLMSYFRMFFRRLFQDNKKNNTSLIKKQVYRKRNIIKSLCKNITFCKFDPMDKTLQSKLDQLKIESNNIIKSVKIIKGLLKLFGDRKISVAKNTYSIENSQQNKDILILNAILKDKHNLASTFTNLTETHLKQIDYIRDNTKTFIQSIENFALILNDIMNLLRNSNKQRISRRKLRCTKHHQNESIKNATVGEKIQKMKNLLINYNLLQNRFMKGMFDVLVTLDPKPKFDNNKLAKVSDDVAKYNENHVIDNYTKNIINNLRKLKNLAEKLSFKNRIKRSVGDDDAIDYFLVLIEYLLKQNRPLDVPPVSDGIDLLIEAIKNSPEVKPIQKKVFEFVPLQAIKTDAITTESVLVPPNNSENQNNETKIILKANKAIKVFESLDEDSDGTNMYEYSDKSHPKSDSDKENKLPDDKTTITNLDVTTLIPNVYIASDNDEKINIVLDTFDIEKNDDKRGYEVFVDDTDEDEVIIVTSTQSPGADTEIDNPVTQNIPKRTTFPANINENYFRNSLNTLKAIKKTKIDWIEENLSREENRREINLIRKIKETTTQISKKRATRTLKMATSKYSNPVSSISKEAEDERQGKTMNPEYLMHKKQMNLLNSLDYGTEKSVLDSESKEEKFNSESFPFVM